MKEEATPPPIPVNEIFKVRVLPRDVWDVVFGLSYGVVGAALLFGVPAGIVYLATSSLGLSFCAFVLFYVGFCAYVGLLSVPKITVDNYGIGFSRLLGRSRRVSWPQIDVIEEISRWEAFVNVALSLREPSMSLSLRHHFRISWGGDSCYHAPNDVARFKKTVAHFLGEK